MATFKIVISDPKSRKAFQKEIEQADSGFLGKKIGENVPAGALGLEGYSLQITGGSDNEGFPLRQDVDGAGRKRLLLSHPPGYHPKQKGQRKRKSVRGNTISDRVVQINAKVVTYGKKSVEELLGIKKEEPKKEAAEEKKDAPAEKTKEEKPAEKGDEKKESGQEAAEKKMGVKKLE